MKKLIHILIISLTAITIAKGQDLIVNTNTTDYVINIGDIRSIVFTVNVMTIARFELDNVEILNEDITRYIIEEHVYFDYNQDCQKNNFENFGFKNILTQNRR